MTDSGRIRFGEERDIGGVISTTFAFLRETWRELGLGLLYIAGPALLLTGVASFFLQSRVLGMMREFEQLDPEDPSAVFDALGGMMGPSYVLTVLGGLVAGVLVTAVVYGYVRLYRAGQAGRVPPGVLWDEASHLLSRSLRVWLAIAVIMTLCVAGMALFCLGLVALIALLPAMSLVVPAVLLGERTVREGFGDAWRLAARAWLPTLGVLVISCIIWYVINAALTMPSSIAAMMFGLNSTDADVGVSGTMRALLALGTVLGAFGYLFYSIPLVAAALQFYSLVWREAGGGLDESVAAMEQLDNQRVPDAPPPLPDDLPGGGGPAYRGRGLDDE